MKPFEPVLNDLSPFSCGQSTFNFWPCHFTCHTFLCLFLKSSLMWLWDCDLMTLTLESVSMLIYLSVKYEPCITISEGFKEKKIQHDLVELQQITLSFVLNAYYSMSKWQANICMWHCEWFLMWDAEFPVFSLTKHSL